jgi:hypothetical protein
MALSNGGLVRWAKKIRNSVARAQKKFVGSRSVGYQAVSHRSLQNARERDNDARELTITARKFVKVARELDKAAWVILL